LSAYKRRRPPTTRLPRTAARTSRKGDIPTNGRFLFYELEQPKKYDGINPTTGKKWARTPLQDVSVATMHLRENGLVPWGWIEDESRTLTMWRTPTLSSTI
jgi:hypothetical protein